LDEDKHAAWVAMMGEMAFHGEAVDPEDLRMVWFGR